MTSYDSGLAFLRKGQWEQAQHHFFNAVQEDPYNGDAWFAGVESVTRVFNGTYLSELWQADWNMRQRGVQICYDVAKGLDAELVRDLNLHSITYWIYSGMKLGVFSEEQIEDMWSCFEWVVSSNNPEILDEDGLPWWRPVSDQQMFIVEIMNAMLLLAERPPIIVRNFGYDNLMNRSDFVL